MKRNQKVITFGIIVAFFLVFSVFSPIKTMSYDWNLTHSTILEETDNVGYGYLTGNHYLENQYLEADYATDIRYVREGSGSIINSMDNSSSVFRSSEDSSYYQPFSRFNYLDAEWKSFPTYIQAMNNTGYGPNLNFTTGINDKGKLLLNAKTSLILETDTYYVFTIDMKAGEMYDLNMKSTGLVNYYIFFEDTLSMSGTVDGITRDIQPLVARDSGDHILYLFATSEVDVIINPKEINVQKLGPNDIASKRFVNEPDEIWNETRDDTQTNYERTTTHAYYIDIPAGDYQFKYVRFDPGIITLAIFNPLVKYYEVGSAPGFQDFTLGFMSSDKFTLHFEYGFKAVVFIIAEYDNTDYIEFDYIFSVKEVAIETLSPGVEFAYQDDTLNFGINIEEKQAIYLNRSIPGPLGLQVLKYVDSELVYGFSYNLREFGEDAAKIILEPGYYYFLYEGVGTYDFDIIYNTIDIEPFTNNMDITLEQDNGNSSNYKLLMLNYTQFEFYNYNFSFLMNMNYTLRVHYNLFLDKYQSNVDTSTFTLGNQQVDGDFYAYNTNISQELTLFSPETMNIRYLLVSFEDIYNNTGATWADWGVAFVNQTEATIRLSLDSGYPDGLNGLTIQELDIVLDALGRGSVDSTFDIENSDYDLFMMNLTVPENTWYKIIITIENGTMDLNNYVFHNDENIRPDDFEGFVIYNKYLFKDPTYTPYLWQASLVNSTFTHEIQFGVLASDMIFMYGIDHVGLNGTVTFEFISYNCTEISAHTIAPIGGLSKGVIIGLAVAGGVIVVGTAAGVMVRYLGPKGKTPSQPATPPPPRY
ncbi:MAG: hypothetical protein H7641_01845 [Candidatus Heimdallarchaeota archaeon]|nr:hypothetical protein [Candidatus Heimdallarchaeota archaeon]MCK4876306.1 hypothetical protein [Candidatus Heimdallarchaeota archaeon]